MYFLEFLKKNFRYIKLNNRKKLLKKFIILFFYFIFIPPIYLVSFLNFLVFRLISPFVKIRIQRLISQRLGHFLAESEIYLCEKFNNKEKKNIKIIDLFYYDYFVCNHKVDKMVKDKIIVLPKFILKPIHDINIFFNIIFEKLNITKNLNNFIVPRPIGADRDIKNLLEKSPQQLTLTGDDEYKAKKCLIDMGIKDNKFVCLAVRDENYIKVSQPKMYWKDQNFRNGNIYDYLDAAEELTKRGYFVLRMGLHNKEKLMTTNPMIIDYSFSEFRSDLMDIYLGGNCTFCISSGLGFDAIPYVFRRPIAYVYTPIGRLFTFAKDSMAITKNYYSDEKKRYLNIDEIFENNLAFITKNDDFDNKKIQITHNLSDDIKNLVIEMDDRLNDRFNTNEEE
ncbi:TIGR04372 family glycosyltransferase, partial [Candidatus Pelagibacter sp.]|nr:TIGR04372 family glycosyltransferase [Candidatus Pelagibacter sp.]